MIGNIGIFILFLCPLIFFHELGHFLFAKIFGVRVEVFSIGFGPKLFKFKKGDTEYAFSLIPFGGYVKMYGDDFTKKGEVPEEERKNSFVYKGKWARFWIVFGGPLANFILAYFLFFGLMVGGEKLPEAKFGVFEKDSKFHSLGVNPGDSLRKINGKVVVAVTDLPFAATEYVKTVTISRRGVEKKFAVNMPVKDFIDEFVKSPPVLRKPVIVDSYGKQFAISTKPDQILWEYSLDEMSYSKGLQKYYLFAKKGKDSFAVKSSKTLNFRYSSGQDFFKKLDQLGYRDNGLSIRSVKMKSPADKAGFKSGDIIKSLQGISVYSFSKLRDSLQKTKSDTVAIEIWRNGRATTLNVKPEVQGSGDEEVKLIGVYSDGDLIALKLINTKPQGFFSSLWKSLIKTINMTGKMLTGFQKLITGQVSLKNIGGPIAIGKVASDSFKTSISYFLQIMAIISINLGLINLFPIPVLDGGHIMFILLELINRGPLSRRKMEIAQQLGLSLLLILMFITIFNDVSRLF